MNDVKITDEDVRIAYILSAGPLDENRIAFDAWLAEHDAALVAERDAAREQLAAAEAVIEKALDGTRSGHFAGLFHRLEAVRAILSAYTAPSTLTEET